MGTEPVLIVGCGDIGCRAAGLLNAAGIEVHGLRRNAESLPAWIFPITADITRPASLAGLANTRYSQVIITTSAGGYSEATYRSIYVDGLSNILRCLGTQAPGRLLLASSTSVYGQNDGSWIDEDSSTEPAGFSGRILLEAEALAASSGIPATIVRFGGIYGPGRTRLLNSLRQGRIVTSHATQYSNRIHSDDCAGVLAHLVGRARRGDALAECYLAVDGAPAPLRQVCEWLALEMGLDPATMVEQPSPLRGGNKRCRNRRLLDSGYQFRYPDYRAGFAALLHPGGALTPGRAP